MERCIFCLIEVPPGTKRCPTCDAPAISPVYYGSLGRATVGDLVYRRSFRSTQARPWPTFGDVVKVQPDGVVLVHWRNRKQPEPIAADRLALTISAANRVADVLNGVEQE